MPQKAPGDKPDRFDMESFMGPADYLNNYSDNEEGIDDDFLHAADTSTLGSSLRPHGKRMNHSSSSWQRIEALNESRRLRALLKEYYED